MGGPASSSSAVSVSLAGCGPSLRVSGNVIHHEALATAGIDESKLSVAADVTCPLDNVIEMSGNRVKDLVNGCFAHFGNRTASA